MCLLIHARSPQTTRFRPSSGMTIYPSASHRPACTRRAAVRARPSSKRFLGLAESGPDGCVRGGAGVQTDRRTAGGRQAIDHTVTRPRGTRLKQRLAMLAVLGARASAGRARHHIRHSPGPGRPNIRTDPTAPADRPAAWQSASSSLFPLSYPRVALMAHAVSADRDRVRDLFAFFQFFLCADRVGTSAQARGRRDNRRCEGGLVLAWTPPFFVVDPPSWPGRVVKVWVPVSAHVRKSLLRAFMGFQEDVTVPNYSTFANFG